MEGKVYLVDYFEEVLSHGDDVAMLKSCQNAELPIFISPILEDCF